MPLSSLPGNRSLRVGLAGYGVGGRQFHVPALLGAGLEVAVVSTSSPERVAQVETELRGARVVTDLDAMLDEGGLDLVVLTTPTGLHAEHAVRVVEAGIALVVDKPLAVNASEAGRIVDLAAHRGVPLTVFQNRRYDPELAALLAVRDGGLVGEIRRAEYRWDRWRPEPKQRWRETQTAEEGAGLLLDLGAHLLDQAVILHGEVDSVYAEVFSRTVVAEDDFFVACRHTSGVVSHVMASSVNGAPGPRARLMGSTGAYVIGRQFDEVSAFGGFENDGESVGWVIRGDAREPGPVVGPCHQSDFYRAVGAALLSDDPQAAMPVDPRDAVHVLAVVDAARVSHEGQRVVEVLTPGEAP
ncbi:MAG TPA: Gfo/Idh/MocA family oxidoreductase [Intrasporangium sp.]|uniref:Gfo/Idh/MocA family protein n=1 Tax=Intrasporangium sp. TaxID=1925024 RepID=UPI002B4A1341|nr:Gfo/Idh/MocA family oxidoreductase [Intrasporangium sp.]HKX66033.1 Gfo/Idh/MocA family oxidoreductase [Intrasporangium sp.]